MNFAARPQSPAGFDAVDAGQHEVEHYQVGCHCRGPVECRGAIGRHLHGVPFISQGALHGSCDAAVVIQYQYTRQISHVFTESRRQVRNT